jgi:hypothetical protein
MSVGSRTRLLHPVSFRFMVRPGNVRSAPERIFSLVAGSASGLAVDKVGPSGVYGAYIQPPEDGGFNAPTPSIRVPGPACRTGTGAESDP